MNRRSSRSGGSSRTGDPGRSGGSSRRRRRDSLPGEGTLQWMLALPARLGVRWVVIMLIMVAALGAYGGVLTTARPMPPSQAPAQGAQGTAPAGATPR